MVDGKSRGQVACSSYITRCCGLLICSWSWKLLLSFSIRSKLDWGIWFLHTITKLTNYLRKKKNSNVPACWIPEERKKRCLKLQCLSLTCRSALTSYSWPRFHIHHFWTVYFKQTHTRLRRSAHLWCHHEHTERTRNSSFGFPTHSLQKRRGWGGRGVRNKERLFARRREVPYGNRLCKSSAGDYKSNIFTTLPKDAFQVITVLGFI